MQRMCSRRAVPLNWIGRYAAVLTRPCGLIPRFTGSPNRGSSVLGFCTARSVLRNEQGKRPLKIRTLGQFGAAGLFLPDKVMQPVES